MHKLPIAYHGNMIPTSKRSNRMSQFLLHMLFFCSNYSYTVTPDPALPFVVSGQTWSYTIQGGNEIAFCMWQWYSLKWLGSLLRVKQVFNFFHPLNPYIKTPVCLYKIWMCLGSISMFSIHYARDIAS